MGNSFPAIKIGLQFVDPYTFVFMRFLIATIALSLLMMLTQRKSRYKSSGKRLILFLGIINGAAYLLQYIGMAELPLPNLHYLSTSASFGLQYLAPE